VYKFLKTLIVVWTLLCTGSFIYGLFSSFEKLVAGPAVNNSITTGWFLGTVIGMGFWFLIWLVPTAVLGVLAWACKPDKIYINQLLPPQAYIVQPPPIPPPLIPQPAGKIWIDHVFDFMAKYKAETAIIVIVSIIIYIILTGQVTL
jgi:hypothetical protein